jgi:hypothetical protein
MSEGEFGVEMGILLFGVEMGMLLFGVEMGILLFSNAGFVFD